ncbi:MAG: hypothetical protein CVV64_13965 [Candidatus Wallbacteria bacterium HGW-Wallbacteria-1]|jgi:histidinol-phosphate aminotransferase|uniref:Aminotransferase class I/classII large domain-containing protein n=1 Tax=Candidatus Wallbacteria bacterium HGW-Wallbacteria-1 TaxID=2013854 RepID=A0A2N1PMJ2_9BACT|nr:MAG: hypothetical protein CVV64_13965 [Candidatus Wallbacteria bacterium HGW-Wallbacteria-1]
MRFPGLNSGLEPQERLEDFSRVRLHLNENPFSFPEEVSRKILAELDFTSVAPYYHSVSARLEQALSDYTGCPGSCIDIGNGGDDLIYTLLGVCSGPGRDRVVTLDPSYYYYSVAIQAHSLEHVTVELDRELEFSTSAFLRQANHDSTCLIFLCNSNNPTGHLLDQEQVVEIINGVKDDRILVVDEAYWDFSSVSFAKMAMEKRNVIVLRTLSKMFSFAGMHLGYIIAHPETIREYAAVKNPYGVNYSTQIAAAVTLENRQYFLERRDELIKLRQYLSSGLIKIGFTVMPSFTNFLLVSPGSREARDFLVSRLDEEGISVRPLGNIFDDCVRISIGTQEKMKKVLDIAAGF